MYIKIFARPAEEEGYPSVGAVLEAANNNSHYYSSTSCQVVFVTGARMRPCETMTESRSAQFLPPTSKIMSATILQIREASKGSGEQRSVKIVHYVRSNDKAPFLVFECMELGNWDSDVSYHLIEMGATVLDAIYYAEKEVWVEVTFDNDPSFREWEAAQLDKAIQIWGKPFEHAYLPNGVLVFANVGQCFEMMVKQVRQLALNVQRMAGISVLNYSLSAPERVGGLERISMGRFYLWGAMDLTILGTFLKRMGGMQ